MINIKQVSVAVFLAIKNDKKLLELIDINRDDFIDDGEFMKQLRKQIVDSSFPDDMLNDNSIRLCIHEQQGGYVSRPVDVKYLAIDIHITKDKNVIDRRALLIMQRLVEVLDTKERNKQCKDKLPIGLYGLEYIDRYLNQKSTITGWEKHSVIFKYGYLL